MGPDLSLPEKAASFGSAAPRIITVLRPVRISAALSETLLAVSSIAPNSASVDNRFILVNFSLFRSVRDGEPI